LSAAAAAIVFAALSVESPLALFANAKASLLGVAAGQAGPAPIKAAAAPVPADRSASPAQPAPTRDEIAAALRAALQSQPEIRQPPAAAAPVRRLDADELAALAAKVQPDAEKEALFRRFQAWAAEKDASAQAQARSEKQQR
jgi:hypothetical protein